VWTTLPRSALSASLALAGPVKMLADRNGETAHFALLHALIYSRVPLSRSS
jgi:hypothetical protein